MTAKEQGLPEAVAYLRNNAIVERGRLIFHDEAKARQALAALASDTGERGVVASVCDGCPHLATEYWRDYLDNDETDSGTKATCNAAKRCIDVYWRAGKPSPEWCPAAALRAQPAGGGEQSDRAAVLLDSMAWQTKPDTMSHDDAGSLWVWAQDAAGLLRALTQPQPVDTTGPATCHNCGTENVGWHRCTPPESGGQGEAGFVEELRILKRICVRGRDLFFKRGMSEGVDMFEHMETEVGRLLTAALAQGGGNGR